MSELPWLSEEQIDMIRRREPFHIGRCLDEFPLQENGHMDGELIRLGIVFEKDFSNLPAASDVAIDHLLEVLASHPSEPCMASGNLTFLDSGPALSAPILFVRPFAIYPEPVVAAFCAADVHVSARLIAHRYSPESLPNDDSNLSCTGDQAGGGAEPAAASGKGVRS